MNNINVVGNLTRDPELKYIGAKQTPSTTFTVAVNRNYKGQDGKVPVDFLPVQILGKMAEAVVNYTRKGSKVAVTGSMRIDNYEKDGEKRSFAKIQADRVEFISTNNTEEKASFKPQNAVNPSEAFNAINDEDIPF